MAEKKAQAAEPGPIVPVPRTLLERLVSVQARLKAPKSQYNKFGKYSYRSAEDIQEALKPLLAKEGLLLTLSDEVVPLCDGERWYVKATAKVTDGEQAVSVTAWAREDKEKKGMDGSQITGTASSYARKYALNGLFLIDDTKDADATNDHGRGGKAKPHGGVTLAPEQVTELRQVFANYRDALGVGGQEAMERLKAECGIAEIGNAMPPEDYAKARDHMLRAIAGDA